MSVTARSRPSATGAYRLEGDAAQFFGSPILRLIRNQDRITGRFGRYGVIKGAMKGNVATLVWKDVQRSGWLIATFDESYRSFEAEYGLENPKRKVAGRFTARRVRWS